MDWWYLHGKAFALNAEGPLFSPGAATLVLTHDIALFIGASPAVECPR